MPDLLKSRAVRLLVLVAAVGVGGVAGAPTMALPPRPGITISGGDDPDDGGGGGGDGPPRGPLILPPDRAAPVERILTPVV